MTPPSRRVANMDENTILQGRALDKLGRKEPSARVVARHEGCPIVRIKDYDQGKAVYEWVRVKRTGGVEGCKNPDDIESLMVQG